MIEFIFSAIENGYVNEKFRTQDKTWLIEHILADAQFASFRVHYSEENIQGNIKKITLKSFFVVLAKQEMNNQIVKNWVYYDIVPKEKEILVRECLSNPDVASTSISQSLKDKKWTYCHSSNSNNLVSTSTVTDIDFCQASLDDGIMVVNDEAFCQAYLSDDKTIDESLNQNNNFNESRLSIDDVKPYSNANYITNAPSNQPSLIIKPEDICSLDSLTKADYSLLFNFLKEAKNLELAMMINPQKKESLLEALAKIPDFNMHSEVEKKAINNELGPFLSDIRFKSVIGNPIVFNRRAVKRFKDIENSIFEKTNFYLEKILKNCVDIIQYEQIADAMKNKPNLTNEQKNEISIGINKDIAKHKFWLFSESAKNKGTLSYSFVNLTVDENNPYELKFDYKHTLVRKPNEQNTKKGYVYNAFYDAKRQELKLEDLVLPTKSCSSNRNIDFIMTDYIMASLCKMFDIKTYNFSKNFIAELPILRTHVKSGSKEKTRRFAFSNVPVVVLQAYLKQKEQSGPTLYALMIDEKKEKWLISKSTCELFEYNTSQEEQLSKFFSELKKRLNIKHPLDKTDELKWKLLTPVSKSDTDLTTFCRTYGLPYSLKICEQVVLRPDTEFDNGMKVHKIPNDLNTKNGLNIFSIFRTEGFCPKTDPSTIDLNNFPILSNSEYVK